MKKITKIVKCFFYIFINLFFFNFVLAQDINIEESVSLSYVCELEKKILKNSEYNYQTFLAKDLEAKDLEKFEINAKQPKTLLINGLSLFLSKEERLIVKVVNKDIVLFKAIDKEKNYSESGIIDRKSGELIHEITKKLKSEKSEFMQDKINIKKVTFNILRLPLMKYKILATFILFLANLGFAQSKKIKEYNIKLKFYYLVFKGGAVGFCGSVPLTY